MKAIRQHLRRLAWIGFALLALANVGCLLVAAGVTASAVAGYYYVNGLLYRDYHANLADAVAAVRTSLSELEFPILEQSAEAGGAGIKTKTNDGRSIRIHLDVVNSPIPSEGALTRIGIRVGSFGDEAVSARILDQVNKHLVAPGQIPLPPQPPTGSSAAISSPKATNTGVKPATFETPAPPLAPQPVTGKGVSAK